jgi:hypothetical protein
MASEFTRLVDDLGYAKTFYPTSKVLPVFISIFIKTGKRNQTGLFIFGSTMYP